MGLILLLAWMFNTIGLDELFQILNSIKGLKGFKLRQPQWSNTTWRFHRYVLTSREQVSCIFFVRGGIDRTYKVQTYTSEVTFDATLK